MHPRYIPSDPGSSPRMRGTLSIPAQGMPKPRFIPAHAGNAIEIQRETALTAVHPRACGERMFPKKEVVVDVGSSPRMRGTRTEFPADLLLDRFIPAHAGNAAEEAIVYYSEAVHPRACGERFRRIL